MAKFQGNNVKVGTGTLYAAPVGTAEPVSVSGAWPAGWRTIGYTDTGSEFDSTPTTADVLVEEEYFPVRIATVSLKGSLTFSMAEVTLDNLALSLNAGTGGNLVTSTFGTLQNATDAAIWQEVPLPGQEVRVALGWDALVEGATAVAGSPTYLARLIARQCLQTGSVKRIARKGNNKAMYAVTFSFEKPPVGTPAQNTTGSPFRWLGPPQDAS